MLTILQHDSPNSRRGLASVANQSEVICVIWERQHVSRGQSLTHCRKRGIIRRCQSSGKGTLRGKNRIRIVTPEATANAGTFLF